MSAKKATKKATSATGRRRRFVEHYLASGNATLAAEKAGYKNARVIGARLLKVAEVAKEVALQSQVRTEAVWLSREERLVLLSGIATGQVKETSLTLSGDPVEGPAKLRDRIKAMELMGRMCGDFIEKRELSGPNGGPIETSVADGAELARKAFEQAASLRKGE